MKPPPILSWEAICLASGERHVIPLGDLRPHEESAGCWCRPTDDDGVWVHHALDNRERHEGSSPLN